MTKYLTTFSGLLLALAMTSTQAEPVMNLITINTNDPAGYSAWAKDNAENISKANNANIFKSEVFSSHKIPKLPLLPNNHLMFLS